MTISEHKTFGGVSMEKFREWFEKSWWSWKNCINFRLFDYNDNIDRCAFFCEICSGWYEMLDEYNWSQESQINKSA